MSISWQEYESAVLAHIRQEFAGLALRVFGTDGGQTHQVVGRYSRVSRQLDVAVYGLDDNLPVLLVDAKRQSGKLDVKDVECFLGMADDVGTKFAGLVAPDGYTPAAERRARAASMDVEVLTIEQALTCRWLPLAQELYPCDWIFRREMASLLRLLNEGAAPHDLMVILETIAYEEWDALVRHAVVHHRWTAQRLLLAIAEGHPEDTWRYNAVQHLSDSSLLDEDTRNRMLSTETDSEVRALLAEETL